MQRMLSEAELHKVLEAIESDSCHDLNRLYDGVQIDRCALFNQVAMAVARLFIEGRRDFHYGDAVMNTLFSDIVDLSLNADMPEPAFSIYLAFDAGEYRHPGDGQDELPWEKWTRPALERILREADEGASAEV
ncbi:hypothetical protein DWF74_01965 [Pseudomonas protegens]|nr:hypothetical protein DWF74_01965 [Pseudomonas protegens]PNG31703.1 hypothetical protein A1348_17355 [Pseudomonas protegens]